MGGVVDRVLKPEGFNHHKGAHCSLFAFQAVNGKVIKWAGLYSHSLGKTMTGGGNFYDFKRAKRLRRYDHKSGNQV